LHRFAIGYDDDKIRETQQKNKAALKEDNEKYL